MQDLYQERYLTGIDARLDHYRLTYIPRKPVWPLGGEHLILYTDSNPSSGSKSVQLEFPLPGGWVIYIKCLQIFQGETNFRKISVVYCKKNNI